MRVIFPFFPPSGSNCLDSDGESGKGRKGEEEKEASLRRLDAIALEEEISSTETPMPPKLCFSNEHESALHIIGGEIRFGMKFHFPGGGERRKVSHLCSSGGGGKGGGGRTFRNGGSGGAQDRVARKSRSGSEIRSERTNERRSLHPHEMLCTSTHNISNFGHDAFGSNFCGEQGEMYTLLSNLF